MNKIKLVITVLLIFILQGCCFKYQPELVDKIVQPLSKEIEKFYLKYNRYPNDKELDNIFTKIKWKKITVSGIYNCNGYKCDINTAYGDTESVDLRLKYNYTFCSYYFKNGKTEKQCYKEPCFSFRQ